MLKYKILDFHTHAFPDKLAPKALATNVDGAFTNGTYSGLLESMNNSGIEHSLILPIATRVGMCPSINESAAKIDKMNRFSSFGTVHPQDLNWDKEIEFCLELGLKGIKLHPLFQSFILNEKRIIDITKYAVDLGLYVLIHAGDNPVYDPIERATPKMIAKFADIINDRHLIFAHLGSRTKPKEDLEFVAGLNCYLDTAICNTYMSSEELENIIIKHGADRILYGSDSPWGDQRRGYEDIIKLNISSTDKANILYNNGAKILGLPI